MFCVHCGAQLPDNTEAGNFCSVCGRGLYQSASISRDQRGPAYESSDHNPLRGEKSGKRKGKKWIAAIAVILLLALSTGLILHLFVFGGSGSETIYVLTKETRYNSDGVALGQYEYTYDECARVLSETYRMRDGRYEYDETYDVDVWIVDEDCEFETASIVEYSYDDRGNLIATDVVKDHGMGVFPYEYDYRYTKDGCIKEFTQSVTYGDLTSESKYDADCDRDGNIVCVTHEADESYKRVVAEFEYDEDGRLTREIFYNKTHIARFDYSYDQGELELIEIYTASPYPVEDPDYSPLREIKLRHDENGLIRVTVTDSETGNVESIKYSYESKGKLESIDSGEKLHCETDKFGNVICVEAENGGRIEYEYKKMKVSEIEARQYRSRAASGSREYFQIYRANETEPEYYYLIPNPVAELIRFGKFYW